MSVICKNQHGWVVDHQAAVAKVYEKTRCYYKQTYHEQTVSLKVDKDLNCYDLESCRNIYNCSSRSVTEITNLEKNQGVNVLLNKQGVNKVGLTVDIHEHSSLVPSEISTTDERTVIACPVISTTDESIELTTFPVELDKAKLEIRSFVLKSDMFAIHQTFMMDTQFEKIQQQIAADPDSLPIKRKRKRKSSQHQIVCGEDNVKVVCSKLKVALSDLLEAAQCQGHLVELDSIPSDNNLSARSAAQIRLHEDHLADLCEKWKTSTCQGMQLIVKGLGCYCGSDIVNRQVENDMDESMMIQVMGEQYLIPASCSFLMSSMEYLLHNPQQLRDAAGYDLIVIDPPWQNKSVKRKKSYYSLSEEVISMLPVSELAAAGCLVAMWCTNKSRVLHFVTQLVSSWRVQQSVTWHWLKVTTSGKPVLDIDSTQKQPYEMLVVARMAAKSESFHYPDLPAEKTIISIPCSLHSKKPPLLELLLPYLPTKPRCLELFARNLWPGWTSWGNEVLRHQHIDFYTEYLPLVNRPDCKNIEKSVVK